MKSEWNRYYNQCNESNDQTFDFKYYSANSKKSKLNATGKSRWQEIESIEEQRKLRRDLIDLLDYRD